ncbi:hypothetical protein LMH66_18005 [Shewanella sp. 10N.7]|uniref:hypothetical protein n=1 Tax=Shewanella sp. 10N.7 TaxID=2885093 RepID=UPI001E652589|nr:hypothetical protein [Shewanella sp. 10N.7]MCC4834544.1 hypothetical protein [Shewanella sp. 10N.7]
MKYLVIILALLSLSACGSSTSNNDSTPITTDIQVATPSNELDAHHLACRRASDEQLNYLSQKITSQSDLKGVLFYFHGGLSGEGYMKGTLGPLLQESIFNSEALNSYYPVFINYDAHPYKDGNLGKSFVELLEEAAKDTAFNQAGQKFKDKMVTDSTLKKSQKGFGGLNSDDATAEVAKSYLQQVSSSLKSNNKFNSITVDSDEYYYAILEDDFLAQQINDDLVKLDQDFREIEEELAGASVTSLKDGDIQKGIIGFSTSVVIAKSLARIALGTNHQIVPTFEEEAFRAYNIGGFSIQKVATAHWNTVKKNAQECFADGSAGDKLVKTLVEAGIPIHTISHSAGSIPTGHLLKSMKEKSQKLASVNLIVPAISQEGFSDIYLKNLAGADNIYGYVLSRKQEEVDSIVWGIYPASLLYAVSGVAEGAWHNDKMLMIEQHMRPTSRVYGSWFHKMFTGDKPKPVWKFLANNSEKWYYYPSKQLPYNTDKPGKRSSHECTKYPWVSPEVATSIIKNISGVTVDNVSLPNSPETIKDAQSLNKKCDFY